MSTAFLLPDTDDPISAPFWEGCARGELLVQRFLASGNMAIPPRPMDPVSRTLEHEWVAVSGRGSIWSFVVAHPPLLPAYAALAPYNVVVVALDEDPTLRLVGNLVASEEGPINGVDPATIRIGDAVRVVFQRVGDAEGEGAAVTLPRWVRVED